MKRSSPMCYVLGEGPIIIIFLFSWSLFSPQPVMVKSWLSTRLGLRCTKRHTSGWVCKGFSRKSELRWEVRLPEWMFLGSSWYMKTPEDKVVSLHSFVGKPLSCLVFHPSPTPEPSSSAFQCVLETGTAFQNPPDLQSQVRTAEPVWTEWGYSTFWVYRQTVLDYPVPTA